MKRLLAAIALSVLLMTAGFIWFVADARTTTPATGVYDGIVALTGGSARIDASLTLLRGEYGQLLLISGVGAHVTLHHLSLAGQGEITPDLAARITLGRRAISTIGNAHETADWAHAHHLHRLLIVTAGYHMRRAMTEIHRVAPDLDLAAYPVVTPGVSAPLSPASLHLLAREYIKFLGAELGYLTGLPDGNDGLTPH